MKNILSVILAVVFSLPVACSSGGGGGGGGGPTQVTLFGVSCESSACNKNVLLQYELESGERKTIGENYFDDVAVSSYGRLTYRRIINGKLYFIAETAATGTELFVYDPSQPQVDGTNPGLVADLHPGASSSHPTELNVLNGKLYFFAENPSAPYIFYVYDPSQPVSSGVNPLPLTTGFGWTHTSEMTVTGSKIVFSAYTAGTGSELAVYDTLQAAAIGVNPKMVEIAAGAVGSGPGGFVTHNGILYFSAFTTANGSELWKFDPSAATSGTNPERLSDIRPGTDGGYPSDMSVIGDKIFFTGDFNATTREFYVFDTTQAPSVSNPSTVFNYNPNQTQNENVRNLRVVNGKIFGVLNISPTEGEAFVYDPEASVSATNPEILNENGAASSSPDNVYAYESLVFYSLTDSSYVSFPFMVYDASTGETAQELTRFDGDVFGDIQVWVH